jgi:hypothetical protein
VTVLEALLSFEDLSPGDTGDDRDHAVADLEVRCSPKSKPAVGSIWHASLHS